MLRSQSPAASAAVARSNVTSSLDRCLRIISAFLHSRNTRPDSAGGEAWGPPSLIVGRQTGD